ncbi:hypothetical protein LCGC14_1542150, partial [marine sediment metagenome]
GSLVTTPPFTFPQAQIRCNNFSDSKLNIVVPFAGAVIMDNIVGVQNGTNALATNGGIDLNGGHDNVISRNVLGGQYESGGNYRRAGATDDWGGNIVTGGVVNGVINPPWTSTHPGQ